MLPAFFSALLVFVFGMAPADAAPEPSFYFQDKVAHFFVFGFVFLTHYWAAMFLFPGAKERKRLLGSVGTGSALGLALELAQATVPHRSAEFLDLVADVAGAACAAGGVWFLRSREMGR